MNVANLDRFFETIESGYFVKTKDSGLGVQRSMREIVKLYGNRDKNFQYALDIYRNSRSIVLSIASTYNKVGYGEYKYVIESEGFPIITREIKDLTQSLLKKQLDQLTDILEGITDKSSDQYLTIAKRLNYYEKAVENFNLLWNDIYENLEINKDGRIIVDESVSTEEIVALYDKERTENSSVHIIPSDEWNQETRSSAAVKNFLNMIQMSDGKYMNWREAYIRMLQLFEGVTPGADNFKSQLEGTLKKSGNHARSKKVLEYFETLENDALRNNYMPNNTDVSDNMKFTDENTFVFDSNKNSVENIYGEDTARQNNLIVEERKELQPTRDFIIEVATKHGLEIADVAGHFKKFQAMNQYRALLNHFNNQKSKNIWFVESEYVSKGVYKVVFTPGHYQGVHKSIKAELDDHIAQKFNSKEELTKWIDNWLKPEMDKNKNTKYAFVKSFLHNIGVPYMAKDLPNIDMETIYTDIKFFFDKAVEMYGVPIKNDNNEDITEERETDMADILNTAGMKRMTTDISDIISKGSKFIRATNVQSISGKKKYLFSPSSFANNLLFNLVNTGSLKEGKINVALPAYINTPFFKKNIFISGINKIFNVIDHDGIKRTDGRGDMKEIPYSEESESDHLARSFVAGFLDRASRRGKEYHYYQFLHPNEREQIMGVEVKILDDNQINSALYSMIKQLQESTRLTGVEINNLNKFTNFRLFKQALGKRNIQNNPLSESEIHEHVKKIRKLLIEESKVLAAKMIDLKMKIDKDFHSNPILDMLFNKEGKQKFENASAYNKKVTKIIDKENQDNYAFTVEDILPIVTLFIENNYVNAYGINQLITGDFNQYQNEEDIMRRFSLATAPGFKPLVHNKLGVKKETKVIAIGDNIKTIEDIRIRLESLMKTEEEKKNLGPLVKAFKENFKSGDGQGFMLPERYDELRNAGFSQEFNMSKILKPVIYSINDEGVARGIKYSSIVLSDELVSEFPSLGQLRKNMRAAEAGEAVFASGIKIGIPESVASFEEIFKQDYVTDPTSIMTIPNDHYRIQLDPTSKIDSKVTQPSQMVFLSRVMAKNAALAKRIYSHLARIAEINGTNFFEDFKDAKSIERNIKKILRGKGNERAEELFSAGLSINFPVIADKVIINLSSHLQVQIVKIPFKGSKLVLQSEMGVRKYRKTVLDGWENKLRYIRDEKGRLMAEVILPEGFLPQEYEDRIKKAIEEGKNAEDFFDLPDLVGWRIPSSDIHSGIAMKVVGFYSTPGVNVIIAPDLLVALHGSDFDVDSLFIVKREEDKNRNPIGYVKDKKTGKYVFNKTKRDFLSQEEEISYHKNGIVDELLDLVSNPRNLNEMLAGIPMESIREVKKTVLEARPMDTNMDMSNYNSMLASQSIIFDAVKMTGVMGNFAKAVAYMFRTGTPVTDKDGVTTNPVVLRDLSDIIKIGDKEYKELSLLDDDGVNLMVSTDGFINASIDNIRELAIKILNINSKTVNGFLALRSLGVPLDTAVYFINQPVIHQIMKSGIGPTREMIIARLGTEPELTGNEVTKEGLKEHMEIKDIESIEATTENAELLKFQLQVLEQYRKADSIGDYLTKLSQFLMVARVLPVTKVEIDDIMNNAGAIFGEINDDGTIPEFKNKGFSFDISEFFKENNHILTIFKHLKRYKNVLESSILKYNDKITENVNEAYSMLQGLTMKEAEAKELIRNEFINYLISAEIYNGEYALDQDVVHYYKKGDEDRVLTGPKAVNQIFIEKVSILRSYLAQKKDADGNTISNQFLDNLSPVYNKASMTRELRFDGGTTMDRMDMLDLRQAFYELNRYEVNYDKNTRKYTVVEYSEPRGDTEYSNFQKEFVSYGVMNWGLGFGSMNYSLILPEDLYLPIDKRFNKLLNRYITDKNAKENWNKVKHDFVMQFALNNASYLDNVYFRFGSPEPMGERTEGKKKMKIYNGRTDSGVYFDAMYENPEGKKSFPEYLVTRYLKSAQLYRRINDGNSEKVYYHLVGKINGFKYYNTTPETLEKGYNGFMHFTIDDRYERPILNIRKVNMDDFSFDYYGPELKVADENQKGEIVSYTALHDVGRVNKQYREVIRKSGNTYFVQKVNVTKIPATNFEIGESKESNDRARNKIVEAFGKRLLDKIKVLYPDSADYSGFDILRINGNNKQRVKVIAKDINKVLNADVVFVSQLPGKTGIFIDTVELDNWVKTVSADELQKAALGLNLDKEISDALYALKLTNNEVWEDPLKVRDKANKVKDEYTKHKTFNELMDSMIERAKSQKMKAAFTKLKKAIIDQGLGMQFGLLKGDANGGYTTDGMITIDLYKILLRKPDFILEQIDKIVFHEMVHGVTVMRYLTDPKFAGKIDAIIGKHFTVNEKTNRLIPDAYAEKVLWDTNKLKPEDIYGLKSTLEFVSEALSNENFAKALDQLYPDANKKNLLRRIFEAILEMLNFRTKDENYNEVESTLMNLILKSPFEKNWIRIGENTYRANNGEIFEFTDDTYYFEDKVNNESDEVRKKVLEFAKNLMKESDNLEIDKDDKGKEKSTYTVKTTQKKILRITSFIFNFKNKKYDPNTTFGQYMADQKWKGRDKNQKLQTEEGNEETYDEYRERIETKMVAGQVKGKIVHLYLMRTANRMFKLGYDDAAILKEINNVASELGDPAAGDRYNWIEKDEVIRKVFGYANINILSKEIPESIRDITWLPEISIWDEKIGIGGTADALIFHADGRASVIDFKTGNMFGIRTSRELMKYGLQHIHITDNQREVAKLQAMSYAFLLKLKYPDMRFRDLMTVWIPNQFLSEKEDMERYVEVDSYLEMLRAFFNDKQALKEAGIDPDIMKYILDKSPRIFDATEYTDKISDGLYEELVKGKFGPEVLYKQKVERLQTIFSRLKGDRQIRMEELPEPLQKEAAQLWQDIATMRSDPSLQLDVYGQDDIGLWTEYLGNYSDVNMGHMQVWVKERNKAYNTYTQQHYMDIEKLNKLMEPVYDQYMKGKLRIKRGGYDRIASSNYAELFAFAYKSEEIGGYERERMLIPSDPEWNNLSKEQQTVLTFLNDTYAGWFGPGGYLSQKATSMQGKDYNWLELENINKDKDRQFKYYPGWFPKKQKTNEEINYEEGAKLLGRQIGKGDITGANILGRFSPKTLREKFLRSASWFIEDNYEGWRNYKMSLPIKYLDNFVTLNSKNYTRNLVFSFDGFNKSMLHKQHMDGVFMMGQGLKTFLQLQKDGNGQPMFERTVGFLEKKLLGDIQNRMARPNWTRTPITIGKYYDISLDKLFEALTSWTSMTTMWLRPLQGGGNGLHAKMVTYREAMKGSIASSFLHIDGDAIDFKLPDMIFADKVYFSEFLKNSMFGDLKKDKTWLLASKLNYLPDNYDYATNRRFLLSTRNNAISESTLYMFHSKMEEWVSLSTMIAQLHYLKNPVTGKSLWDSYSVEQLPDGRYDAVWKGGTRGYEQIGKGPSATTKAMTELTDHEIAKLKKVHERMQGGYRKEEAANLEIYMVGKMVIQFKKYFPRLLMNALSGKRQEVDLGYYKKLMEDHVDPKTGEKLPKYEWVRRINEGRWRTIMNVTLAYMNFADRGYRWDSLSSEQKQNVVDGMLTLSMFGLFAGLYAAFFYDDDDDDTFKKWWWNYLVMNTSQQYNPVDLLNIAETMARPVALARLTKLTESTFNMFVATGNLMIGNTDKAFTQKGDLKGWNEVMRSIPYLASWHDFANKMKHGSFTEDWWVDKWENQWR